MSFLEGVETAAMAFADSNHVAGDVQQFVGRTLGGWGLDRPGSAAGQAAQMLVQWTRAHGPAAVFRVEVTLDRPVLLVELVDRDVVVPNVNVSREDAAFGLALLGTAALEWGAELDSRGRRLWVSFRASPDGVGAGPS